MTHLLEAEQRELRIQGRMPVLLAEALFDDRRTAEELDFEYPLRHQAHALSRTSMLHHQERAQYMTVLLSNTHRLSALSDEFARV